MFFCLPVTLSSMGLSWMLDLRTQLCIYTSGQQISKMAQAWSPSTVNVMLRVSISTFSTKTQNNKCFAYQTLGYQYSTTPVALHSLERWLWKVYNFLFSEDSICSRLRFTTNYIICELGECGRGSYKHVRLLSSLQSVNLLHSKYRFSV